MGFKCNDFRCQACGNVFEDVLYTDEPNPKCPVCGGDTTALIGGGPTNLYQQGMYPYPDRGLGLEVQSAAHRQQVCRERNLIPVDGSFDVNRDMGVAERQRQTREEDAAYDEYMADVKTMMTPDDIKQIYERGRRHQRRVA